MSTNGTTATRNNRRVMIVTGATSGIGRSLARAAAKRGFAVVAIGRNAERLEAITQSIRDAGGIVEPLRIDVTANDAPQQIVDTAMRTFGRIDVVVNNAGAGISGNLLDQSDAAINGQVQLH